jgi:hypothetical protein
MTLDYSTPGKVKLLMKDYIIKMLEDFQYKEQLHLIKYVTTRAAEYLFQVNNEAQKLERNLVEEFHTTVAKGPFLWKRARPDLQPTIAFLCTRVKQPDEDDWKKLPRMLKYIDLTKELELTLGGYWRRGVALQMVSRRSLRRP